MRHLHRTTALGVLLGVVLLNALARLHPPPGARRVRDERGDVPGWVMVTVMTAGLVAVLTAVAGPQLQRMLTDALASVR